ncbi:hypothetical protein [Roseovarius nitratireducens]|uniref:hypothetical protein n=1 Tax=Roseovarius nitratireducens TaxID=2044597 RepID=UPI001980F99E|nr:hypothetical protein [Roseovarius nitratireducens]
MTDGRNQKLLRRWSHIFEMNLKWPRIIFDTPAGILSWAHVALPGERHGCCERVGQTINKASQLLRLPIFFVGFLDAGLAGGAFTGALQLILRADVTR